MPPATLCTLEEHCGNVPEKEVDEKSRSSRFDLAPILSFTRSQALQNTLRDAAGGIKSPESGLESNCQVDPY